MFGVCTESAAQVAGSKAEYTAFMSRDNGAEKVYGAFSCM
jgi:hypothetical protein